MQKVDYCVCVCTCGGIPKKRLIYLSSLCCVPFISWACFCFAFRNDIVNEITRASRWRATPWLPRMDHLTTDPRHHAYFFGSKAAGGRRQCDWVMVATSPRYDFLKPGALLRRTRASHSILELYTHPQLSPYCGSVCITSYFFSTMTAVFAFALRWPSLWSINRCWQKI